MSEISSKLAKGAMWIAAGRVIFVILGLINTVVLARILSPDDFGLVAIALTINMIIQSLTSMPLSSALVQHEAPERAHFDTAFTLNIIRAALIGVVIVGLSFPISSIYDDPRLLQLFFVIAIATFLNGFQNPFLITLTRKLLFWQDFLLQSIDKFMTVSFALTIALVWQSYWALMAGFFAGQLFSTVTSYIIVPFLPRLTTSKWRELVGFSVWITFKNMVDNLNWRSGRLLLGYVLGNASLGLYNVGQNLAALPTNEALKPILSTLFPAFSRIRHDRQRLARNYLRTQSVITAIAIPVGFMFAFTGDEIVPFVLGEKWTAAVIIVQFSAVLAAIQVMADTLNPLALSLGKTKTLFHLGLIEIIIRLPIIVVGVVYWGLLGFLVARSIVEVITLAIRFMFVRKLIGIPVKEQVFNNWPTFVACAAMLTTGFVIEKVWRASLPDHEILKTLFVAIGGFLVYGVCRILIWYSRGKKEGPEYLILHFVSRYLSRNRLVSK